MCATLIHGLWSVFVKRNTFSALVLVLGLAGWTMLLPEAHASLAQEAKKICLERYNVEKEGGTLPAGMPKSKYVSQCTRSFIRNAQLEAEMKETSAARGTQNGTQSNAGENELTVKPGQAPKTTTARQQN